VRVHLNQAQWEKAGEVAREAADTHITTRERLARRRAKRARTSAYRRMFGWVPVDGY
jgi:hypothetical protein